MLLFLCEVLDVCICIFFTSSLQGLNIAQDDNNLDITVQATNNAFISSRGFVQDRPKRGLKIGLKASTAAEEIRVTSHLAVRQI